MKTLGLFFSMALGSSIMAQPVEGTSNAVHIKVGQPEVVAAKEEMVTLQTLGITQVPKYYALVIGVSEYQNAGPGLPNLDMPVKDAEKLASLLVNKYTFEQQDVTLLKNPSREEIINQLDQLTNNVTEKDNVLIFYAGHGFYDKSKEFGFWLPSDAKAAHVSRSAWIANSQIKDYVGAIKAKHTLLITDACFGGSIFKSRSVDAMLRRFHEMYKDKSRKAITSGNLSEVPDNSIFLKFLLKTLEENQDLFLSTATLNSRIYEPVSNNTTTIPQFGVIQGAGDEGGDFIFIKRN